jgi:hypothetical protein
MIRRLTPGFALLFILLSSLALAQTTLGEGTAEAAAPNAGLPDFAGRTVSGESVVDLADFICGYLADTGTVPDFAQVQTAAGSLRRISAAEAFVLLARTAYLWEINGQLPETVPIAPDDVSAPVLDPEDLSASEVDLDSGVQVATEQFLAQCGATVSWVDRLHIIPTAVWVEDERLSAMEYLAGLAICIQYAYWEGELYDYIFLPAYASPQSWIQSAAALASAPTTLASPAESWPSDTTQPEQTEWEAQVAPLVESEWEEAGWEEEIPASLPSLPVPLPKLVVFPEPGSTLSGIADIVASYTGPPARFVIFDIDGKTQVIMNYPPYSCRWDTSALEPGTHSVRVQVLGDADLVLADQVSAFAIVSPQAGQSAEDLPDDL